MSYILNALRKSEQERPTHQTIELEETLLKPLPEQKNWLWRLALGVIIFNIIIWTFYFFYQQTENPRKAIVNVPDAAKKTGASSGQLRSSLTDKSSSGDQQSLMQQSPARPRHENSKPRPQISFADRVESRPVLPVTKTAPAKTQSGAISAKIAPMKVATLNQTRTSSPSAVTDPASISKAIPKSVTAPAPTRALAPRQPSVRASVPAQTAASTRAAATVQTIARVPEPAQAPTPSQTAAPVTTPARIPVPAQAPAPERTAAPVLKRLTTPEKLAAVKPSITGIPEPLPTIKKAPPKPDIPFLRSLPFSFRRSVPRLNINVFVYSEEPAERFVLVNMKKYTPGQQLVPGMQLQEIRSGSLVVKFKNKTFQIPRP